MLPSVRAWNLLAQGELSDAVLLTATLRRSREKMVQPGRMDSSLKQWQGDMQVPQTLLWVVWGQGAALFPADTWSWYEGQHSWERGSFYLSLRLCWNSNPQPASACLAEQVRECGPGIHILLSWKLRFHPTLSQVWPPDSTQPSECPASRTGKQAEATVNNLLLSI